MAAISFFALQLTLLVFWAVLDKSKRTRASIPSAAINLGVASQIVILSWVEDARSVRPSSLLNIYLLITILFDVAQVRTLWLKENMVTIAATLSASTCLKMILLLLEAHGKRDFLRPEFQGLSPEATSGIISRSFLWWVNNLFHRGYCAVLALNDLYVLDQDMVSAELSRTIQRAWIKRHRPERRFEFTWVICRVLWRPLLLAAIPRLLLVGLIFAQPFLITRTLDLLSQPDIQLTNRKGYGLIGAAALIYIGLAILRLHSNQYINRFVTMFRGATVSLIYSRALGVPDSLYDESAAVTLMSTDVDRIAICLANLNECWARALEVVFGLILLAFQLGWVCVMPIVVVVSKCSYRQQAVISLCLLLVAD